MSLKPVPQSLGLFREQTSLSLLLFFHSNLLSCAIMPQLPVVQATHTERLGQFVLGWGCVEYLTNKGVGRRVASAVSMAIPRVKN